MAESDPIEKVLLCGGFAHTDDEDAREGSGE
jgi:hypothetical protein